MNATESLSEITPRRLNLMRVCGGRFDLIDVSTPAEYEEKHVPGARNLPIGSAVLEREMARREWEDCPPLYVMCRGGVRSVRVCKAHPDANLVNVEGGTKRWELDALPLVQNERNVSGVFGRPFSILRSFRIQFGHHPTKA